MSVAVGIDPGSQLGTEYPRLSTRRFQFRPFRLSDIQRLVSLAGEHRVADTAIGIPQPYTPQFARMWILTHAESWEKRDALHWAVEALPDQRIWGYAGLSRIDWLRGQAELRFWVGSGLSRSEDAIEWATAIIEFAFTRLGTRRLYALQLLRHQSIGRVLARVGMQQEGLVRKRFHEGGIVEDAACWAIGERSAAGAIDPFRVSEFSAR